MTRGRLALIIAGAVALIVFGFLLDGRGFGGNLVAAALEILLTVTIIAWLIERSSRRRWGRARGNILLAVTYQMAKLAHEFMAHLEGEEVEALMTRQDLDGSIAEGYDHPAKEAEDAITSMAELMKTTGHELMSRQGAKSLYEGIRGDLAQVRGSLTPLTVALGDEPELAGRLVELDHAARRWTSQFPLDDYSAVYHYVDAVDLMGAISSAYSCCMGLYEGLVSESKAKQDLRSDERRKG